MRTADLRLRIPFALALALAGLAVPAQAQRERWGNGWLGVTVEPNVPYDGRFTFARIRYTVYGRSGWQFDYPQMERNLLTMMRELTTLRPHVEGSNIHTLDDPALLRYPVAYLSEPGYWHPSDAEIEGLRQYLKKGGFLIVDDFMRSEWANFEEQIRRVLPDARIDRLKVSHPIFDVFFRIPSLDMKYPHNANLTAEFFGIHEDNDPDKPPRRLDGPFLRRQMGHVRFVPLRQVYLCRLVGWRDRIR